MKTIEIMKAIGLSSVLIQLYTDNELQFSDDAKRLSHQLDRIADLRLRYRERGIPDSYLISSLTDLKYRIERYMKLNHEYGLSEHDVHWLKDVFEARFFDIGTLRFQIFDMDYGYIERTGHDYLPLTQEQKHTYPEGCPLIQIHILKGADLSIHHAIDALVEAYGFFNEYFPEIPFKAFIARTWLIHPGMVKVVSEKSNMVQFGNLFDIIRQENITYQVLERSFGTSDLEVIETLPKETSLQKNIVKYLNEVGVALGVIDYKHSRQPFNAIKAMFSRDIQVKLEENSIRNYPDLATYSTQELMRILDVSNHELKSFLKLMVQKSMHVQ